MFARTFGALAVVACVALPASASTTYDFTTGPYGHFSSLNYSQDGIGLTVKAGQFNGAGTVSEYNYNAVYRSAFGLGVDYGLLDSVFVDGHIRNDVLTFTFNQNVQVESVTFSFWERNDEFRLFSDDLASMSGQLNENSGCCTYNFSIGWIADRFGIGAWDNDDEFKIKSLTVSSLQTPPVPGIPEPATWLMMVMGFGLVGLSARRRALALHHA